MKIIDITPETESHYFCCLEEWSEDMKEAGDCKRMWYIKMKEKGLRVKFAVDDNNVIGGMIQYLPVFMRASWFRKHGYKVAGKSGIMRLLWKPFNTNAAPPRFRKPVKKPLKGTGKVSLALFRSGWCQSMNITCERAKRAALDFPDKIDLQEFDTTNAEILKEWGISDSVYLDGKEVMTGPPITYEKIRRKISKRVDRVSS